MVRDVDGRWIVDFDTSISGTVHMTLDSRILNKGNLHYTLTIMSEAGPSTQAPPVVEAGQGKKRKRTGKEREERKQAAILAVSLLVIHSRGALISRLKLKKKRLLLPLLPLKRLTELPMLQ